MPALISHQIIAEAVLQTLPEGFIKDKAHFYFGAQGGDPFYSYKYITSRKKVNFGMALHRNDIYKTFENFRKFLQKSDDFAAFSYVLGYITHYAADIIFHPFVYYLVDKYKKNAQPERAQDKVHYLIESDIDLYFLQTIKSSQPLNYNYPIKYSDLNTASLFELYQKTHLDLCGEPLHFSAFDKAVRRFFFLNKLLVDKKQNKRRFVTKLENFFKTSHIVSFLFMRDKPDNAYTNIENDIWHNLESPNNIKKFSAAQLFNQSVELSKELILDFFRSLKNNAPLEINKFSTDFNEGIK